MWMLDAKAFLSQSTEVGLPGISHYLSAYLPLGFAWNVLIFHLVSCS